MASPCEAVVQLTWTITEASIGYSKYASGDGTRGTFRSSLGPSSLNGAHGTHCGKVDLHVPPLQLCRAVAEHGVSVVKKVLM